jgi:gas vesicle protein
VRAYSFIIGALVGGAAAYYYMNHQSEIKRGSYQVKARYSKVKDTISDVANDVADDLGDIIGKQES